MKAYLTNTFVDKLKPKAIRYDVWDTQLPGFHLRVFPSGKMTYRYLFKRGKVITVGSVAVFKPGKARERARDLMALYVTGNDPVEHKHKINRQTITLRQYISQNYATWVQAHRKTGQAILARIGSCFFEKFGDKTLLDLTTVKVEQWRTKRLNLGIKSTTINRDINALKSALSKAVEWGLISEHPLRKFKPLKTDVAAKVRYLTKRELTKLKAALAARDAEIKEARRRANQWREIRNYRLLPDLSQQRFVDCLEPMILLSLNTGLRRGELFHLKWTEVNLLKKIITLSNTKSGKTRHVPLNKEALKTLTAWRSQTILAQELVFPAKTGSSLVSIRKAWASLLKKAEITNFRWHDMRHHFASSLVMVGVDLNTVRELMGHADIKMTLRYAHLAPEHKAAAVEKIASY